MDDLVKKVIEMVANKGYEIPPELASNYIDRFGVKTLDEVDDDFIEIILSRELGESWVEEKKKQNERTNPLFNAQDLIEKTSREKHQDVKTAGQYIDPLLAALAEKTNLEAEKIASVYKGIPGLVKAKVIEGLHDQIQEEQTGLSKFRKLTDVWYVISLEHIENAKTTRRIVCLLGSAITVLMIFTLGETYARYKYQSTEIEIRRQVTREFVLEEARKSEDKTDDDGEASDSKKGGWNWWSIMRD